MVDPTVQEVSVREHLERVFHCHIDKLEKEIDLRFNAILDSIAEAKRLMEERMAGFPREYARKGDLEFTAATVRELKEKDLEAMRNLIDGRLTRDEYAQKHEVLLEKIDRIESTLQEVENIKANLQGRILATGGAVIVIVALIQVGLQVVMHIFWSK